MTVEEHLAKPHGPTSLDTFYSIREGTAKNQRYLQSVGHAFAAAISTVVGDLIRPIHKPISRQTVWVRIYRWNWGLNGFRAELVYDSRKEATDGKN